MLTPFLVSQRSLDLGPYHGILTAFQQGKVRDGISGAHQRLSEFPQDGLAWYLLGVAKLGDNALNEAMDALKKSLELRSDLPETHLYLAEVYKRKNVGYQAIEHLLLFLQQVQSYGPAMWNLAMLYLEQNAPHKAQPLLLDLWNSANRNAEVGYYLALTEHWAGNAQRLQEIREWLRTNDTLRSQKLDEVLQRLDQRKSSPAQR